MIIRLGYVSVDYQPDILNSDALWQFCQLQHWQRIYYYLSCLVWAYLEIWEETVITPLPILLSWFGQGLGKWYTIFQKSFKLCPPGQLTHFWKVSSLFSFSYRSNMPKTSMQIRNMSNHQSKLVWGKGLWHSHPAPILFFLLLPY